MRKLRPLVSVPKVPQVTQISANSALFLFDGSCSTCNRWVKFLNAVDKRQLLYFVNLDSQLGLSIQAEAPNSSFVLKCKAITYLDSDAVIFALSLCRWPLSWFLVLRLIPAKLRDKALNVIAKRLQSATKNIPCERPDPGLATRILTSEVQFESN